MRKHVVLLLAFGRCAAGFGTVSDGSLTLGVEANSGANGPCSQSICQQKCGRLKGCFYKVSITGYFCPPDSDPVHSQCVGCSHCCDPIPAVGVGYGTSTPSCSTSTSSSTTSTTYRCIPSQCQDCGKYCQTTIVSYWPIRYKRVCSGPIAEKCRDCGNCRPVIWCGSGRYMNSGKCTDVADTHYSPSNDNRQFLCTDARCEVTAALLFTPAFKDFDPGDLDMSTLPNAEGFISAGKYTSGGMCRNGLYYRRECSSCETKVEACINQGLEALAKVRLGKWENRGKLTKADFISGDVFTEECTPDELYCSKQGRFDTMNFGQMYSSDPKLTIKDAFIIAYLIESHPECCWHYDFGGHANEWAQKYDISTGEYTRVKGPSTDGFGPIGIAAIAAALNTHTSDQRRTLSFGGIVDAAGVRPAEYEGTAKSIASQLWAEFGSAFANALLSPAKIYN